MNYLAVVAAVLLLGGGGAVAGAVYVGEVDWDAYFSDDNHHVDIKTSPLGDKFSVIHVDPTHAEDGQYYSVTKCEFYDCQGPLVIVNGCAVEKVDGGFIFSIGEDQSKQILVSDVRTETIGGLECYVISDQNKIEIQHVESTEGDCKVTIYSAESFFNMSVERRYLVTSDAITSGRLASYTSQKITTSSLEWKPKLVDIDLRQLTPVSPGNSNKINTNINWEEYFSDAYHFIDYKHDLDGNTWSNVHTDPEVGKDGKYYSVTRLEFRDCQGSIVIGPACTAEKHATGYIFSLEGYEEPCTVFIPDVKTVQYGEDTYYVISNSSTMKILSGGKNIDECNTMIYYNENFMNRAVERGILKLVKSGTDYSSLQWDTWNAGAPDDPDENEWKYEQDATEGWSVRNSGVRNSDSDYYATLRVRSSTSQDSLKIDGGCDAISNGDGFIFTVNEFSLNIPNVRIMDIEGKQFYILSDSNVVELIIKGSTEDECRQNVMNAEAFFNKAIETELLRQSLEPTKKSLDDDEDSQEFEVEDETEGWSNKNPGVHKKGSGYYSFVRVKCNDSEESLKIDGSCEAVQGEGGYTFTINGFSLFIPGAYAETVEGRSYYVISTTNTIQVPIEASTQEACKRMVDSIERFFNDARHSKMLYQTPENNHEDKEHSSDNEGDHSDEGPGMSEGWIVSNSGTQTNGDGYYSVIEVTSKNSDGSLKIRSDCESVQSGEGYTFSLNGGSVYIPDVTRYESEDSSYYIVSGSNTLTVTVNGDTFEDCRQLIDSAELFFRNASETGVLYQ